MTAHPRTITTADLPENTRRLLSGAFADTAFIGHAEAAELLGFSEKTLREMGDEGRVRYGIKGKRSRIYTEADIIAVLMDPEKLRPCPSTSRKAPRSSTMTSSGKVVGFTARRGRKT